MKTPTRDIVLVIIGVMLVGYAIGLLTARQRLPPYKIIDQTLIQLKEAIEYKTTRLDWQYFMMEDAPRDPWITHNKQGMLSGATMVSGFTSDPDMHRVAILDYDGGLIQEWELSWKSLWPGPAPHIPDPVLNRDQHHPHGAKVAANGDLVFNFTELATLRVNPCGQVVWRLEKRGHHSVEIASDNTIWVPGVITHYQPVPEFPNHIPPFEEFTILNVSESGEVLREVSINKLLIDNDLKGLLYLSTLNELTPVVKGDTLHVNDIEIFPDNLEEGIFKHGDILISLRNINSIMVVDPADLSIRHLFTGMTQRQHDADFHDGNTVSVFDNNNVLPEWFDNQSGTRGTQNQSSRILRLSAQTDQIVDQYDGGETDQFFTDLMGNHQIMENGNTLIVEARAGRAFEVSKNGELLWEYYNILEPGLLGAITYAERLSPEMDAAFFENARSMCQ